MNGHLIDKSIIEGLRLIPNVDAAWIIPTPIAAPNKLVIGVLGAVYLNPINIIYYNRDV